MGGDWKGNLKLRSQLPVYPVLRLPASPAQSLLPERDAVHKHGADRGGAGTGLLLTLQMPPWGLGHAEGVAWAAPWPCTAICCLPLWQRPAELYVAAPSHP